MGEPFKGTLKQCLDKLRQLPLVNIQKFTKFTQAVDEKTVWGWLLDEKTQPSGIYLVRAMCFFRLNGWNVKELEALDPLAVHLAELWGYGVMQPADIKKYLGYVRKDNQGLLHLIYGESKFMPSHRLLMQQLIGETAEAIEQLKRVLLADYAIDGGGDEINSVPPHADTVALLAAMLRDVHPLALVVNSDDFSDTDRDRLRELVGRERYGEIAVHLSQMKSAKTRADAREGRVR